MPMETLDIGDGQSRITRFWSGLSARRRWSLSLPVLVVGIVAGLLLNRLAREPAVDLEAAAALPASAASALPSPALRPPPWVTGPRTGKVDFAMVNLSSRRVFVSNPPRFMFTIEPHGTIRFCRLRVCSHMRFSVSFTNGRKIDMLRDFCHEHRWVLLPSGRTRLD
jgi:hypothetical protein